jgi:hypothetical protein
VLQLGWDWPVCAAQASRAATNIEDTLTIADTGETNEQRRQACAPATHELLVSGGIGVGHDEAAALTEGVQPAELTIDVTFISSVPNPIDRQSCGLPLMACCV